MRPVNCIKHQGLLAVFTPLLLAATCNTQPPNPDPVDTSNEMPATDEVPATADGVGGGGFPNLKLPFTNGETWVVTRGYNTLPSHINRDVYALDFGLSGCVAYGKPVLAAADGVVHTRPGPADKNFCGSGSFGSYVSIDHGGGYTSLYAHLSSISVSEGTTVVQGQEIGKCGNTGDTCCSTVPCSCTDHRGTHLHFRLQYYDGITVTPVRPEPMSDYSNFQAEYPYTSNNVLNPQQQVNYTISTSANPFVGGTTGGDGTYASGSIRTVTATASPNYAFVNWTEGGNQVKTTTNYQFTLTGNRTLVANFSYNPVFAWQSLGSGVAHPGFNTAVYALAVHNNALVVGGDFTVAGGIPTTGVASWTGAGWQAMGNGVGNYPRALWTPYNGELVGGGLANFVSSGGTAAGYFTGTNWQSLGSGIPCCDAVSELAVHNGSLYAGIAVNGFSTGAGLMRLNNANWTTVSGNQFAVYAVEVYNGELVAGGIGEPPGASNSIGRLSGTSYLPMGNGLGGTPVDGVLCSALKTWNGQLIAGGPFTTANGSSIPANHIASWNGSSWSPLGSGGANGVNGTVRALTIFNNDLIAGGDFTSAGGVSANHIAKWNGSSWSAIGSGTNGTVRALTVYNDELIAGGDFTTAGGAQANYISRWAPSP